MLKIKDGLFGARLTPFSAAAAVFMIVDEAMTFEGFGGDYELTSGIEGEHVPGSIHFFGLAWDYTIRKTVIGDRAERMRSRAAENLGDDFDVIYNAEKRRLHVEFQPKRSYGRLGT
jgi:hypothetical protein